MTRDDFSRKTLDTLAKRVGVRCSNPACRKLTTGPREVSDHIVNIGVGAHITAASAGGPRYDEQMTIDERKSLDNVIWLCQNCAKLIDNDPVRYTVDGLRSWKQAAEQAALMELEGSSRGLPVDTSADLNVSYLKDRISSKRHDYTLQVLITNLGTEPLRRFHIDVEMPSRVIEDAGSQAAYVAARSSGGTAFFRAQSDENGTEVYPGDTVLILSVPYYMDNAIFTNRGDLFERPVRATLYRKGSQPVAIETPVSDLQIF